MIVVFVGCWMLASMMEGMDDSTSGRHLSFRKMPGSTGNETVCETSESHYLFRSSVVERHSSISISTRTRIFDSEPNNRYLALGTHTTHFSQFEITSQQHICIYTYIPPYPPIQHRTIKNHHEVLARFGSGNNGGILPRE